jgi:hypothetical protein
MLGGLGAWIKGPNEMPGLTRIFHLQEGSL